MLRIWQAYKQTERQKGQTNIFCNITTFSVKTVSLRNMSYMLHIFLCQAVSRLRWRTTWFRQSRRDVSIWYCIFVHQRTVSHNRTQRVRRTEFYDRQVPMTSTYQWPFPTHNYNSFSGPLPTYANYLPITAFYSWPMSNTYPWPLPPHDDLPSLPLHTYDLNLPVTVSYP